MNGRVYYNEIDPFAAAWLKELMHDGLIPFGEIDTRSIVDVQPGDLAGFDQCHFFAGIGGWAYALELAGWQGPVWTGSCPCQPFSQAGKQHGTADKRHLWPEFHRLIKECAPPIVFGEQVASRLGREWLAGVRTDLEALGYGVGAADLCAPGVGAPHIRQRLFWVANTNGGLAGNGELQSGRQHGQQPEDGCAGERVAHAYCRRKCWQSGSERTKAAESQSEMGEQNGQRLRSIPLRSRPNPCSGLGDADNARSQGRCFDAGEHADQRSPWASGVFIPCADGKARRIEPGIQPLADGVPNRVGTLRGAGNAIVPQLAAAFIKACM